MIKQDRKTIGKTNVISVYFDAEFFFERGLHSFQRYDFPKALKYFRKSVDLDPHHSKYLVHLAAVYTELGNYEESNRLLTFIVNSIDSCFTDCYYYMANNYAHLGNFDQAERYALLYIQESHDGIYVEEAEELLDFICFELDREPRELDQENQLIVQHEKARIALEQGKFVEATRLLKEMVEEHPHFLAARNNLALSYYYLGKYDEAMGVIEEILERDQANLHALCNLAVFLYHKEKQEEAKQLLAGLKKVQPFHPEHQYKLATTLGILGEDQRAFELFSSLSKRGLMEDSSLYHYMAVASYNIGREAKALEYWTKLKQLNPSCEIAEYYLNILEDKELIQTTERLPYHYQLPFDVQLKKMDWFVNGRIPKNLMQDPLIRSSLLWSLRYGDRDTKLQVLQSFELLADEEVEEALRQFILEKEEEDYIKKVAIFVLRQIGAKTPYTANLCGHLIEIDQQTIEERFPHWMENWQKVSNCLRKYMEGQYDLLEHQEAQTIWSSFLEQIYPDLPQIRKAEGWAAAIEYYMLVRKKKKVSKIEIAERYDISVQTLSKNLDLLKQAFS
ncbi:tetratricopeptide repeat protein [Bacillus horti]|uniref:Tetratricopeptide (TPR) repeat protein n=1 Tax=Caldalkalibacillus horti TaxID=77523 RepID=A0ABT9W443_9BACI|nr:tetratricopeptide repeat protein [Bacillus horti]MDQ0168009.1 tetratricopeptide (TPR) repeat protein [Bacillus horti]